MQWFAVSNAVYSLLIDFDFAYLPGHIFLVVYDINNLVPCHLTQISISFEYNCTKDETRAVPTFFFYFVQSPTKPMQTQASKIAGTFYQMRIFKVMCNRQ